MELFQPPSEKKGIEEKGEKLADLIARLRLVENNIENIMRRVHSIERSTIDRYNELKSDIDFIKSELIKLSKEIERLSEKISVIEGSLSEFAKKEDVKVIEKYIDFLKPERYVTEEDVVRIVKRVLGEQK